MQGQSLMPLLTGKGEFPERNLYWAHEGNAAIRVGDRKLVRMGLQGPRERFDLKNDRTEQDDLAQVAPERVAQLRFAWNVWAKASQVLPKPPTSKLKAQRRRRSPS